MTQRWETRHDFDLAAVPMLNKLLEGSGWTVGKICYEYGMLEIDINGSKTAAYYSDFEDSKEMYAIAQELEDKRLAIMNDLRTRPDVWSKEYASITRGNKTDRKDF